MLSPRELRVRFFWMRMLRAGWAGFAAKPISSLAICNAESFLGECRASHCDPDQIEALPTGGIGVVFQNRSRRVGIEFAGGRVTGLFTVPGDKEDIPHAVDVAATLDGYRWFLCSVGEYLGFQPIGTASD